MEKKDNIMATMPIRKLLITMAIPLILSMIVQALYNIVDSVFVGMLNDNSVSFNAVSLVFSMQNIMIAVASGVGVGMNAILSRALGAKDIETANKSIRNGLLLSLISYLIFLIVGLTMPYIYMKSMTNDMNVILKGEQYLKIICMCSFGMFFEFTFERMLQATGKANLSMITQMIGAITNIILDPIFMLSWGLNLGVTGAALATITGQIIASIVGLFLNIRFNKEISLSLKKKPIIDWKLIGSMLKVGIPSMIMIAIGGVMYFGINLIIKGYEASCGIELVKNAQSAFGAYYKLQSFVLMPVLGLNNALIPIIAFQFGAGEPVKLKKALRLAIYYAIGMMLIGLIIMEIIPGPLLKIFSASGDMLTIGIKATRIISISFIFAGAAISLSGYFQALGNGLYSMIISICRQLLVLLPVAYLLSLSKSVEAIWWAFPIAEIISIGLSIVLYLISDKKVIKPLEKEYYKKLKTE